MDVISDDDLLMIERRVCEIAFTNPKLKLTFNGKKIDVNSFDKFVKLLVKSSHKMRDLHQL
jgi:hypothetical protein